MDDLRRLSATALEQQQTQPTLSVKCEDSKIIFYIFPFINTKIQFQFDACDVTYDTIFKFEYSDTLNAYLESIGIPKNASITIKSKEMYIHISYEMFIAGGCSGVWVNMILTEEICMSILQRIISDLGKEIIKPK
jgi:hypothetical protein